MGWVQAQSGQSQTSSEDQREQGESPVPSAGEHTAVPDEPFKFSNQGTKKKRKKKDGQIMRIKDTKFGPFNLNLSCLH